MSRCQGILCVALHAAPSTIPGCLYICPRKHQTAHNLVMKNTPLRRIGFVYFSTTRLLKQQFRNERSRTWGLFGHWENCLRCTPLKDTEPSKLLHNKVQQRDPGGKSSHFPPFPLIESGELSVFCPIVKTWTIYALIALPSSHPLTSV